MAPSSLFLSLSTFPAKTSTAYLSHQVCALLSATLETTSHLLSLLVCCSPSEYASITHKLLVDDVYRPDQVKVVLPYAWPMQPEEWRLDRWRAQGFHLFVVGGAQGLIDNPVPEYRAFFRAVDRCPHLASLAAARPLFFEEDVRVYRCA